MVYETTKDKVAHWAIKLECPVDEDANYENTYVSKSLYTCMHEANQCPLVVQS